MSSASSKAVVFGNTADPLVKTAGSAHTHVWRVYLRGARGEDLRPLVARVVFKLHESFQQPVRSQWLLRKSLLLCFLFAWH